MERYGFIRHSAAVNRLNKLRKMPIDASVPEGGGVNRRLGATLEDPDEQITGQGS